MVPHGSSYNHMAPFGLGDVPLGRGEHQWKNLRHYLTCGSASVSADDPSSVRMQSPKGVLCESLSAPQLAYVSHASSGGGTSGSGGACVSTVLTPFIAQSLSAGAYYMPPIGQQSFCLNGFETPLDLQPDVPPPLPHQALSVPNASSSDEPPPNPPAAAAHVALVPAAQREETTTANDGDRASEASGLRAGRPPRGPPPTGGDGGVNAGEVELSLP
ncbi:hypothetical protein T492DRAFT_834643 [Pavlovales sp. CCMP2436]|nr:hypothetical protein T492DRAFT_834643 [Pavlovales sp. CCMP2436]